MGLALALGSESDLLRRAPVSTVELVHVAAAGHPLAHIDRLLTAEDLKDHVQLVLTDRSTQTAGRDYGVYSTQTWRLADLGAKHALLLAGLGWGSMPRHMVLGDIAAGRLIELHAVEWQADIVRPTLQASLIWRFDTAFGVAGQWMRDRLSTPRHEVEALRIAG